MRDRLDGLWGDEDFAGWYPRDGRPGISPAQLATVSVLQFLLDLSDRDAAEAVRCRIDFKYALGLDLDDPGFHHSVLGDFRDRLLEDGRADRLLDLALARLKEAGLVRERTTQRTDSTHVLAAVRDLTRLELVTEAVRAALEELARTAGARAGRPGRRRLGPPLRPPGPAGQEPHPAEDQDQRRRGGRRPAAGAPGRPPDPSCCPAPGWRPCGRSWSRTTTGTPPAACAGAPTRRKAAPGCRPRPGRSSKPSCPADQPPSRQLPRRAHPPAEVVAKPGQLTSTTRRSPTESSSTAA